MPRMNPYLVIAFLCALLASGTAGFKLGMDHRDAQSLAELQAMERDRDEKQDTINGYAKSYEALKNYGDGVAYKLRKELNDEKSKLASCNSGVVRLSPRFVSLYDAALQTGNDDSGQPADPSAGAGAAPESVIENAIENGRRWKSCRDQLKKLIGAVESGKL